jgi:hypothetical protein
MKMAEDLKTRIQDALERVFGHNCFRSLLQEKAVEMVANGTILPICWVYIVSTNVQKLYKMYTNRTRTHALT